MIAPKLELVDSVQAIYWNRIEDEKDVESIFPFPRRLPRSRKSTRTRKLAQNS